MTMVLANENIKTLGEKLHLTQEQMQTATSTALQLDSNSSLYGCDKFSLAKFCFETARYNMPQDYIYPVPYNKHVQVQFGYKFYRELCLRTNLYRNIDAVEVLSCDKVIRDRTTGQIKVEFEEDYNKTIGATIVGYYAFAVDKQGKLVSAIYWSKEKCEEHGHTYSKTYSSTWGKGQFDKMAKKTVIKQLCGTLRITPEISQAIKQDQIVFGGENEEDKYEDNPRNDNISKEEEDNEIVDVKPVDFDLLDDEN